MEKGQQGQQPGARAGRGSLKGPGGLGQEVRSRKHPQAPHSLRKDSARSQLLGPVDARPEPERDVVPTRT